MSSKLYADEPPATPYRPTVSNPAALSAPGRMEVEAGFAHASGAAETRRRASLPMLFKYAFSDRFGILVAVQAQVSQTTTKTPASAAAAIPPWRSNSSTISAMIARSESRPG